MKLIKKEFYKGFEIKTTLAKESNLLFFLEVEVMYPDIASITARNKIRYDEVLSLNKEIIKIKKQEIDEFIEFGIYENLFLSGFYSEKLDGELNKKTKNLPRSKPNLSYDSVRVCLGRMSKKESQNKIDEIEKSDLIHPSEKDDLIQAIKVVYQYSEEYF